MPSKVAKPAPSAIYKCASGMRHNVAAIVHKHMESRDVVRCVGLANYARVAVVYALDRPSGISLHYLKCKCGAYIIAKDTQ